MGVIEKTLTKRAFLDASTHGAVGGAYSLEEVVPGPVHDHKGHATMDAANEDDGDDSKLAATQEEEAAVRQRLLTAPMSPHAPSDRELQGSSTVLVQPGYDGGGSQGEVGDGEGAKHPLVLEVEEEERGPLRSRLEFLLLFLSLGVGTRSLLQYPVLAMRHGGGAFTFVYLVLTAVLGLPLVYMEMALGQYARGGPISAWTITPLSRGLGFSMLLVSALLLVYYNTYTAWAIYCCVLSLSESLPWHLSPTAWEQINNTIHQLSSLMDDGSNATVTEDSATYTYSANLTTSGPYTVSVAPSSASHNHSLVTVIAGFYRCHYAQKFFYENVLGLTSGLGESGGLQMYLSLCLLLAWIMTGLTVAWGPISMSRVSYVSSTVPVALLLVLLGGVCSADGSVTGLRAFLTPHWPQLAKVQMWWDGAKLVLSGSVCGTGVIVSLSAWAHFHSNCFRNSLIITVVTVLTTLLGGCTLFAALGSHLLLERTNVSQLHLSDVDLTFAVLPSLTAYLPCPSLWCIVWFALLVVGAIGVQGALLHNLHSGVVTLARASQRQSCLFLMVTLILLLFLLGLSTVTQGGLYVVQFLERCVYLLSVPAVCLAEVVTLMWLYGVQRLANRISDMTGKSESLLWKWMWKFLCPTVLTGIIIVSFVTGTSFTSSTRSVLSALLSLLPASSPSSSSSSLTSSPSLSSTPSHWLLWPWPSLPGGSAGPSSSSSSPSSSSGSPWVTGFGWLLSCLPLTPFLSIATYMLFMSTGSFSQRLKALGTTPRGWGPRHHEHEPQLELPDYVICSPDVYRPANALALLTANLYLPNLTSFLSIQQEHKDTSEMSGGYLADLMTVTSSEDDSAEDENKARGNWGGRFEFVCTCLGYVVGLGNIWRFPYLVYRNGGGAFFIAYFVILIFCGAPLVYMELAFGQYASLGPITVWKAAPIFKGVGYCMVLISLLVSIYYNMVTAWAFHFLFTSLTSRLPWESCNNSWNTASCTINKYASDNCSAINQTALAAATFRNQSCHAVLTNCSAYTSDRVGQCVGVLREVAGEEALLGYSRTGTNYTNPSEEYFYRSVLDVSQGLGRLGVIKWQMVMCLLLCWIIVFFCLFRGIKTAGKVSYVVALVPYVAVLVLLVRGVSMAGSSGGVNFYTTPKWEQLKQPRMWVDAAGQVFFSLSICWGGLTTLSSYNKFHNNVYRDAILVCLGDTLMSILSGFAVFAMIGVLSEKLGSPVEGVIQSDVGMTFIVYPAALLSFPVPSLWSALFFLMLVTMGLGTTFSSIETIVTAIVDEKPTFLKKRRVYMLAGACTLSFVFGLPLTAQGGLYLLQLMDEYLTGFPVLVAGLCLWAGISCVYGLQRFCNDIQHMIKTKVGLWWKIMWMSVTPVVIVFILISCGIGYQSLGKQFDDVRYPWWSEVLGFFLVLLCIIPIFVWPVVKLLKGTGPFLKRVQTLCRPDASWGPALEKNWNYVEYFPAVQTNLLAVETDHPTLNTITDRVEFTTVGVRIPSVSQTSLLPLSQQQNPGSVRMKSAKTLDMRQKAILNHAYSNPQCNLFYGSAEKLTQGARISSSSDGALNDVVVAHKTRVKPVMKDACTQTDVSCFEKLKRQVSEPIGRATTPPSPAPSLPRSMSWMHEGEPAVIEVEVTKF